MNADSGPIAEVPVESLVSDFEQIFHGHYLRVTRAITSVVRDAARAEDLAVEVFWKLWVNPQVTSLG